MKKILIIAVMLYMILINNVFVTASNKDDLLNNIYEDRNLEYIDYDEYQDEDIYETYVQYLPYLQIDDSADGSINMGGNLNSLFHLTREGNEKKRFSWEQEMLKINNDRTSQAQIFYHFYNRAIYNHRRKKFYDDFFERINYIYNNLNRQEQNEKELTLLKARIKRMNYSISNQIESNQGLINQLSSLTGVKVEEQINLTKYPFDIGEDVLSIENFNNVISLKISKYKTNIKRLEKQLKEYKRSRRPQLDLNYQYSFADEFDETEHKLTLDIGNHFGFSDYDRINYSGSMEVSNEEDTDFDGNANLTLFPYPRHKRINKQKEALEDNLERLKQEKDLIKQKEKSDILERLDKINHFITMYNINKMKEIKFGEEEKPEDDIEKIYFLLDKLEHRLKLEEFKFNYSYLYGFIRRENEEAEYLLKQLNN